MNERVLCTTSTHNVDNNDEMTVTTPGKEVYFHSHDTNYVNQGVSNNKKDQKSWASILKDTGATNPANCLKLVHSIHLT
jgi:hypothetical protein